MPGFRFDASRRILFLACLMYLFFYVDRVNISTAAPIMQEELGLSATQLGFAFSAFAYPYAICQILGGWLADRFGARLTLFACGVLVATATVSSGLVSGLTSLFLARLLLGIGEGPAFPTATRALSNWIRPDQRGLAQGITHSFSRLGNAVTPPVVAALIAAFSWRTSFMLLGGLSLVWAVVWVFYFRDDPRQHAGVLPGDLRALPSMPARNRTEVPWGSLLRRMLPVTLTDFCYGWILWLYLNWVPSFFLHEYGLNLKTSAAFSAGVFLAGVIGDTAGGVLSDWILRRTGDLTRARISVIVLGFAGSFCCLVPILFVHGVTAVAICLSLAFFFAELIVSPIWALPMDIAPDYAGTASGFMNFGFGLAGIISPVVCGALIDATGRWDLPFIASLALLPLGLGLALTIKPQKHVVPGDLAPT